MTSKKNIIHVIGGPTASGKSSYAMTLAQECNGSIINADSLQIYNGLPLLTAQPSIEDKQSIPHFMYGTLNPNDVCSAGNWREMIEPLLHGILEKNQTPLIVGGSGLYIKSLIEGLSPIPDIPSEIRHHVTQQQQSLGNPAFYDALKKIDPIMADRLHPHHTARLIRAYEVMEATGKSLAHWQELDRLGPPENWMFHIHLFIPERSVLYQRCNERFLGMIKNGVLEEVQAFDAAIKSGQIKNDVPLTKALGFLELQAYLNNQWSLEEAIKRAQGQTRRYAKRQTTWFKHQIKNNNNIEIIEIHE